MVHSIHPYRKADALAAGKVWFRSGKATYTYLTNWNALTEAEAVRVFREVIVSECDVWLATDGGDVAGFLAMQGSYLDRLYVDPPRHGAGWGSKLLDHAKSLSPEGVELHTHQQNWNARRFYERRGFRAVRYGVSPPPECAPDIEYQWRP